MHDVNVQIAAAGIRGPLRHVLTEDLERPDADRHQRAHVPDQRQNRVAALERVRGRDRLSFLTEASIQPANHLALAEQDRRAVPRPRARVARSSTSRAAGFGGERVRKVLVVHVSCSCPMLDSRTRAGDGSTHEWPRRAWHAPLRRPPPTSSDARGWCESALRRCTRAAAPAWPRRPARSRADPIMWTPSTSSYFFSATIFTNPSVSPAMRARAEHAKLEAAGPDVVAALLGFRLRSGRRCRSPDRSTCRPERDRS